MARAAVVALLLALAAGGCGGSKWRYAAETEPSGYGAEMWRNASEDKLVVQRFAPQFAFWEGCGDVYEFVGTREIHPTPPGDAVLLARLDHTTRHVTPAERETTLNLVGLSAETRTRMWAHSRPKAPPNKIRDCAGIE